MIKALKYVESRINGCRFLANEYTRFSKRAKSPEDVNNYKIIAKQYLRELDDLCEIKRLIIAETKEVNNE